MKQARNVESFATIKGKAHIIVEQFWFSIQRRKSSGSRDEILSNNNKKNTRQKVDVNSLPKTRIKMETSISSMFSDDFLNTIMGEWVLLNLSDDDFNENETSSTGKSRDNASESEEVVHCYYKCGICGDKILDYCLPKHHYLKHHDVIFNYKMYVPIEIKKQIQCILCNAEILADDFESHKIDCQVENWVNLANTEFNEPSSTENSSEVSSTENSSLKSGPNEIVSRIFRCEACGALVLEKNLDEHHESIHPDILLNVNIFELFEITKQEQCENCEQWVENLKKHQRNYHEMVEVASTSDEANKFQNIFISKQEFERLRHRMDEIVGHFYLRDSE